MIHVAVSVQLRILFATKHITNNSTLSPHWPRCSQILFAEIVSHRTSHKTRWRIITIFAHNQKKKRRSLFAKLIGLLEGNPRVHNTHDMTLFCFESLMTFICRIIGFNLERVMKRPYHINEGSTKFIIGSKLPYEFSRPSVGRSDGWSVVGLACLPKRGKVTLSCSYWSTFLLNIDWTGGFWRCASNIRLSFVQR